MAQKQRLKELVARYSTKISDWEYKSRALKGPTLPNLETSYCIEFADGTSINIASPNSDDRFVAAVKPVGRWGDAHTFALQLSSVPGLKRLMLGGAYEASIKKLFRVLMDRKQ